MSSSRKVQLLCLSHSDTYGFSAARSGNVSACNVMSGACRRRKSRPPDAHIDLSFIHLVMSVLLATADSLYLKRIHLSPFCFLLCCLFSHFLLLLICTVTAKWRVRKCVIEGVVFLLIQLADWEPAMKFISFHVSHSHPCVCLTLLTLSLSLPSGANYGARWLVRVQRRGGANESTARCVHVQQVWYSLFL